MIENIAKKLIALGLLLGIIIGSMFTSLLQPKLEVIDYTEQLENIEAKVNDTYDKANTILYEIKENERLGG